MKVFKSASDLEPLRGDPVNYHFLITYNDRNSLPALPVPLSNRNLIAFNVCINYKAILSRNK